MQYLKSRPSALWLLAAFLLLGLALRAGVGILSPSVNHPDEIFQSLEPAHHLAYGYGVVTWEWMSGVRSWVFPAFLAGAMRSTDWMGTGSRGYLNAIIVLLSAVSLTTVWFGYAWCRRASSTAAAILGAGACAIWAPLIYFAPKAANEVLAGNVLLPGLYLGMYGEGLKERDRLFLAGFFCGLALSLRIQLAPAAAFAVFCFCLRDWRKKAPAVFCGILLPIVILGAVDAFTWSHPFQSVFAYLRVNILEGRAAMYGTEPWWWYATSLARCLGPLLLLAVAGVRRSPFLGWLVLVIVGSHSLIGHKELRFIYPAIPLLVTLAAMGVVEIASFIEAGWQLRLGSRGIVVLGLAFFALSSAVLAWRFPRWNLGSGGLIMMDRLSRDDSVCGVGQYRIPWHAAGGYAHLHRNVPIILVQSDVQLQEQSPGFNALIVKGTLDAPKSGFELEGCWNGVCLYRRPGSCTSSPDYNEVNEMLRSRQLGRDRFIESN